MTAMKISIIFQVLDVFEKHARDSDNRPQKRRSSRASDGLLHHAPLEAKRFRVPIVLQLEEVFGVVER